MNSSRLSSASSSFTRMVTLDCTVFTLTAAAVKLPSSATAQKIFSWRISMIIVTYHKK
ncbi:hypothetical protein D3C85_1336590 [compost metagenome]